MDAMARNARKFLAAQFHAVLSRESCDIRGVGARLQAFSFKIPVSEISE
jgi:hypothetical protein